MKLIIYKREKENKQIFWYCEYEKIAFLIFERKDSKFNSVSIKILEDGNFLEQKSHELIKKDKINVECLKKWELKKYIS